MTPYLGEIFAILTAFCWAITSTVFEKAGKEIGSLSLNIIRLFFAFVFLLIFNTFSRGLPLPTDASFETIKWLVLSGLVGFVLGDLLLFEAFTRIGARISMLIYSSVPPLSGMLAFFILGDKMSIPQILGMVITLTGISLVIVTKDTKKQSVKLTHPLSGILLAFGGALGQSLGYIIGKLGLQANGINYDPFAATHIRVMAAIIGFAVVITYRKSWSKVIHAFKQKKAMAYTSLGSIFGPFIGVSLSLAALNHTTPGVASTLTAITPVILIPVAIFYHKEKLHYKEILGAFVAVFGVAVMFLIA